MNFHINIINPKTQKILLSVTDNLTIKELKEKYMKALENFLIPILFFYLMEQFLKMIKL